MFSSIILSVVLMTGAGEESPNSYWRGYAASVLSHQVTKGTDIIHAGKPKDKPKDIEPKSIVTKIQPTVLPAKEAGTVEPPPFELPIPPIVEQPKVIVPPKQITQPVQAYPVKLPNSYAEAMKYAKDRKVKILIVFSTNTCPNCVQLKRNTLSDQKVLDTLKANNIRLVYNTMCEDESEIADKFNVQQVPFYVVTDGEYILKKGIGYRQSNDFIEWIKND